jgi:hypothetical protein
MEPVKDNVWELLKIQQDTYRSASLQSELLTLQKLVLHLKVEIDRVQKLIDETPVGKIMKKAGVK